MSFIVSMLVLASLGAGFGSFKKDDKMWHPLRDGALTLRVAGTKPTHRLALAYAVWRWNTVLGYEAFKIGKTVKYNTKQPCTIYYKTIVFMPTKTLRMCASKRMLRRINAVGIAQPWSHSAQVGSDLEYKHMLDVTVHELGHLLYIRHTGDKRDIMYHLSGGPHEQIIGPETIKQLEAMGYFKKGHKNYTEAK